MDTTTVDVENRPRRLADVPLVPGLPGLGNALQLPSERLHLQLEAWKERYGDSFRIRLGTREFLVVADPQAIAAALRDRPDGIGRTERLRAVAAEAGFSGVFSANQDAWRRQRPMVLAGFNPRHTKAYFPTLATVTGRFARRCQRAGIGVSNALRRGQDRPRTGLEVSRSRCVERRTVLRCSPLDRSQGSQGYRQPPNQGSP